MAQDFLSQDEVDALLKGVTGEADQAPEPAETSGVRPYNLATQERIVRGRMPTLEIINERFARLLRIGIFNFMRRTAEISVGPVKVQKYGEFIRNIIVPTNLNLVQLKPLRGTGLIIFDPNLVFLVIDNMFGGDGRFHTRIEGREFSQVEQRIIQRLLSVVFENLEKSWASVYPIKYEYVRAEMNTQFANIATQTEVVVTTSFTVELAAATAQLHICMPYSMIEPIRDTLFSANQGESLNTDKRWVQMLSKQIQGAEVELVANLGQAPVTFGQILNMQAGDIISLNIPNAIVAEVDGVPLIECKYGVFNGQYALKVEKMLASPAGESSTGGNHG